jgi:hypothetical protein
MGIVIVRGAGHEVFFGAYDLPPASGYNTRIRDAIDTSDAAVFLVHGSRQLSQLNPGGGGTEGCRRRWGAFGR